MDDPRYLKNKFKKRERHTDQLEQPASFEHVDRVEIRPIKRLDSSPLDLNRIFPEMNQRIKRQSPDQNDSYDSLDTSETRKKLSPESHFQQRNTIEMQEHSRRRRMHRNFVSERLSGRGCINKNDANDFYDPLDNNLLQSLNHVYSLEGIKQNGDRVVVCFDVNSLAKHVIKLGKQYNLPSPENVPNNEIYLYFLLRGVKFNVSTANMKDIVNRYLTIVGYSY